jgi:hypothetical protein
MRVLAVVKGDSGGPHETEIYRAQAERIDKLEKELERLQTCGPVVAEPEAEAVEIEPEKVEAIAYYLITFEFVGKASSASPLHRWL